MKRILTAFKWIFLILVNTLPFGLNVCFYGFGGIDNIFLFLPVISGLVYLNYSMCYTTLSYLLIQFYTLGCMVFSGYFDTYLYYHKVSSDSETLLVGMVLTLIGAGIHVIVTIATAIVKALTNKRNRRNAF